MLPFVRLFPQRAFLTTNIHTFARGFSYKGTGHQCTSSITEGQVITFVSQTFNGQVQSWVRGEAVVQREISSTIVSADGVPIQWQSTDSEVLARAAAATPSAVVTVTATGTPSPYYSPVGRSDGEEGLSVGAKVGIGVGVPVGVILGLVVFYFAFWRRFREGRKKAVGRGEVGGSSAQNKGSA